MKNKATVLVSGMIAADPFQGGATWAVLQYVLGLRELGHRVYFVEPVGQKALRVHSSAAADEAQTTGHSSGLLRSSVNAAYFRDVMGEFGLAENSALLLAGTRETVGLAYEQLRAIAAQADVLLNISGMLQDQALLAPIPVRAYVDLDPAFNQLWSAAQGIDMRFGGHTHFITIGLAIGEPSCPVPNCGLQWLKTLQPIVLSRWPRADAIVWDAFTTIGNWRGYGSIEHQGRLYGQKAHSLRQFFTLPTLSREKFMLALAIHPNETKDLTALAQNGWELLEPGKVAGTPSQYQRFIQGARAEFGITKSGYVVSQCGWFSDRSLCYLASGRPVVAQDTGFARYLPTGEGLFAFRTSDDFLAAAEKLRADYSGNARAARAIAEELFDSRKVLPSLLAQMGV